MRCLGRTIGCLLLTLIIMIAPLSIWLVVVWTNLINDVDQYVENLDDEAYEDMAIVILPAFAQMMSDTEREQHNNEAAADAIGVFSDVMINLDGDDWRNIIEDEIDPFWVRELLQTNLTNILDYWRFESNYVSIQADLSPLANVISGENGQTFQNEVFGALQNLDTCTSSENMVIDAIIDNRENRRLPNCRPTDDRLEQLESEFEEGRLLLAEDLSGLPNYYFDVRAESGETEAERDKFDKDAHDTRRVFFLLDRSLPVILIVPLMLLSLIVVVTVRSAKGFFLWTSIALIGTSFFTVLPLIPWIYGLIIDGPQASISGDANLELVLEVQRVMFSAFSGPILLVVGVMAFIGIGFLVLAALLRNPHAPTQQQVYYYVPSGQTGSYTTVGGTATPSNFPLQQTSPTPPSPAPEEGGANNPNAPDDRTFIPPDSQSKSKE